MVDKRISEMVLFNSTVEKQWSFFLNKIVFSKKQKKMLTMAFTRDSINELRVKHIAAKNLDK